MCIRDSRRAVPAVRRRPGAAENHRGDAAWHGRRNVCVRRLPIDLSDSRVRSLRHGRRGAESVREKSPFLLAERGLGRPIGRRRRPRDVYKRQAQAIHVVAFNSGQLLLLPLATSHYTPALPGIQRKSQKNGGPFQ